MELRNYFSLFCLHQETQLVFIYLPITSHILGAFVNSQVQGHKEVRVHIFPSLQKHRASVLKTAGRVNADGCRPLTSVMELAADAVEWDSGCLWK